jgi:hypothetical protein
VTSAHSSNLFRRDGYLGTEATLAAMEANADLRASPGTATHPIRGSSEGRFEITDSPGTALDARGAARAIYLDLDSEPWSDA